MTQEEKDKSVALFDKEVEDFCKETFINDKETKGLIFCCARHFTDWQKQRTIDKACEWLRHCVDVDDKVKMIDGEPEALSFIEKAKHRIEVANQIVKDFKKAMEQ